MVQDYVLIVDDHTGVRQMMSEILTMNGLRVKTAENGKDAIKFATEEKPKLILLDLRMPGLSGLETLAILNRRIQGLTVVIVGAYTERTMLDDAISNGLVEYFLIKPFDFEQFLGTIFNLMGTPKSALFVTPEKVVVQEFHS